MFLDYTYIILVLPAIILAGIASAAVKRTFKKYSSHRNSRGITGAEAARRVLDANGLQNVSVRRVSGELTDHFDPSNNTVNLSDSTYSSTSTAAVGVACHEVGHAIQHAVGYAPIKIRMAIIPLTNFGANISVPLIIAGVILASFSHAFLMLAYVGVACFALSTLFQLVTLPVEIDASRRALNTIDDYGILDRSEIGDAKKVLTAAAMTYVAALAVSLSQLLYFILMVSGRRD